MFCSDALFWVPFPAPNGFIDQLDQVLWPLLVYPN